MIYARLRVKLPRGAYGKSAAAPGEIVFSESEGSHYWLPDCWSFQTGVFLGELSRDDLVVLSPLEVLATAAE